MEHRAGEPLTIESIETFVKSGGKLRIDDAARKKIENCRNYLKDSIISQNIPVYGVNTGFGKLYNITIEQHQLEQLQKNLLLSHATGMGNEVPDEVVKLMLLLKVQSLSYGHSGVQVETVERLADYYNNNIFPVVYQLGSLGASGDLAPLAHLCIPLLGVGKIRYNNEYFNGATANEIIGKPHLHLGAKEGLALINGTQFMGAYAVACLLKARRLIRWADMIAALSLEAYDGRIEPFDALIAGVRPHNGHVLTAQTMRELLKGSDIISHPKKHVQDPYSFRCVPQVHGATKDAVAHVQQVIHTEINSVTDNPLLFPEEDRVISGGNFHGQPLALVLDYLTLAMAELGSISERRTYLLVNGDRGLPPFLTQNPGINSGFMIAQYTAAAIVSQNKQYCTPASADSITSSAGQEDHVSMGANAATKAYRVLENLERILGIELLTAVQAIEFRRPMKTSQTLENIIENFRQVVPFIKEDEFLHPYMEAAKDFIKK